MNKISTRHFMFFIYCTMIVSLRLYSSVFIRHDGRDTWLIAIIASILITLFYTYLLKVYTYTDTTLHLINNEDSLSSIITKIIVFIFCIGLFTASIEAISSYSSSILTNLLPDTPNWFCILIMSVSGIYILTRKINSILIVTIVISIISLIGDVIYLALILKYLDFNNLLPILENNFNYSSIKCLILILGSMSSVMITLPYLKYINNKNKLTKNSFLSILSCCIIIDISLFTIIAFLGPYRASNIFYPEYIQSQRIQIANFIEFGEIFYIFRNVCMWFIKYILASYGIHLILKDKFSLNLQKNKCIFNILYALIISSISIFLTKNQYNFFDMLEKMQYIFLITFIIIPLICSIFLLIKHRSINRA